MYTYTLLFSTFHHFFYADIAMKRAGVVPLLPPYRIVLVCLEIHIHMQTCARILWWDEWMKEWMRWTASKHWKWSHDSRGLNNEMAGFFHFSFHFLPCCFYLSQYTLSLLANTFIECVLRRPNLSFEKLNVTYKWNNMSVSWNQVLMEFQLGAKYPILRTMGFVSFIKTSICYVITT